MKFSLSWLKRYLKTDASLEALLEAMTMSGLEVEHVHDSAAELEHMSVAQIKSLSAHPDADRLSVCQVDTVDGLKSIVCGAPNVAAGLLVIYAPLGGYIPGLKQALGIKPRKIRGVESQGMMCSAYELCLGEDHDGIIALDKDLDIGTKAAQALGIDDPIIEVEITPNRPDLLGVLGIARDLAATGIGVFSDTDFQPAPEAFDCPLPIHIEAEHACPIFAARLIRGVKNGPSPDWLQQDLAAAGIPTRNILVDITNFLSIDRARPLHVFDADRLSGGLRIGMGQAGQSLQALDTNSYALDSDMCVIYDDNGPVSLGAIMGGSDSAVQDETVNVLLECAWFDPAVTARTGRKLGIDSEARRRFERGVDPASIEDGLDRATRLIIDLAGGEASRVQKSGTPRPDPAAIAFPPSEVARLTGVTLTPDHCQTILAQLGCKIQAAKNSDLWKITPPSFRADLCVPADLVEEIIRITGFDQLPDTGLPACPAPAPDPEQIRLASARRFMAARGFGECVSWSFMDAALAKDYQSEPILDAAAIANPIANDLNMMRPSLLPNLAAAIARNSARGVRNIRLFEAGDIWQNTASNLVQNPCLAALVSPFAPRHWAGPDESYDAMSAKGDLLALLNSLGWPSDRFRIDAAPLHWHPGHSASLLLGKKRVADFGQLHPKRVSDIGFDKPLFGFELYFDTIPASKYGQNTTRNALQKNDQTPIIRDFAFELDKKTPAGDLAKIAANADKNLIESARVFDVYTGKGLSQNQKSVAIEVIIRPHGQPLTEAGIATLCQTLVQKITKATGAVLRQ